MPNAHASDGQKLVGYVVLIVLFAVFLLVCAWQVGATEAPGCGDQEFRPRLAQCCPKFLVGEALPPKCTHALADGFLDQCCRMEPIPTEVPTPNCIQCFWNGDSRECVNICHGTPAPSPTFEPMSPTEICVDPTPIPTPASHAKGVCCAQAAELFKESYLQLQDRYLIEKHNLRRIRKEQVEACHGHY